MAGGFGVGGPVVILLSMMPRRLTRTESVKMGEPAEDLRRRVVQYITGEQCLS